MQPEPSLPSNHAALPLSSAASAPASAPLEEQLLLTTDDRVADRPPDALQLARDSIAAGEWTAAMTTLRALISREPKNVRARAVLAELLDRKGDVEGALSELGRAIEAAPDDVPTLCARAAIYTARGRYELAEADLRSAIRADDRNAAVHIQLGILFCKRARWRDAVEPLRAAVERDPQLVAAHYYLGEAHNSIDDLPAALGAYEQAVLLDPTHLRALKGIGVVLDRLGRPAEAAAAYQRARDVQRR
jgi:Tfp pilus assembly protein PilF